METVNYIANTNVTMRLSNETMNEIESIKKVTGITNRTRLVRSGISLLKHVVDNYDAGNACYIEKPNGERAQIIIK